jgi:SAM-dependent methyltransferase
LRLWLVLPLGGRTWGAEGSWPRRLRKDAGASDGLDDRFHDHLDLPEAVFDLAFSSLVFHYIEDLAGLFRKIHRAIVPGGQLVFSIEHPIYMAPRHPAWIVDNQGYKTWPVDSYQIEGPRVTNWLADGVIKQHRTIGTLLNLLIDTGFTIAQLDEWGPTDEQIAARPELAEERERPMMLLVSARR